jgi:O-antigen ligase
MQAIPGPSTLEASATQRVGLFSFLLWLSLAVSAIVFREPAPYDALVLCLGIVFFASGPRFPAGAAIPLFLLSSYVIATLFSALLAPVSNEQVYDMLRFLGIDLFLLFTWFLFTSLIYENPVRALSTIWGGYFIAALTAATFGVLGYLGVVGGEQFVEWGTRVRATFKDPNVLGPFLVPVVLYLLVKIEDATQFRKAIYLAALLLLSLCIFLTFSRGAWVNLVVSFVLFMALRLATAHSRKEFYSLLGIGLSAFCLGLALILLTISYDIVGDFFFQRATLFQDYDLGGSGGRFNVQLAAVHEAFRNPLGVGPGQAPSLFPVTEPHNLYLFILLESGWLGAVAFYSFVLLSLTRGFLFCLTKTVVQPIYIAIFASVTATLMESFIIHTHHWRHLYLLLGMLWGPILVGDRLQQVKADKNSIVQRPCASFTPVAKGIAAGRGEN